MYKHEESGAVLDRAPVNTDAKSWNDCFPEWKYYQLFGNAGKLPPHAWGPHRITGQSWPHDLFENTKRIFNGLKPQRQPDHTMYIGPFCHISGHASFDVKAAPWVIEAIKANTVLLPDDRMSFEVIPHDNGWALVLSKHSLVSGSVWLAYIKADTIPAPQEAAK